MSYEYDDERTTQFASHACCNELKNQRRTFRELKSQNGEMRQAVRYMKSKTEEMYMTMSTAIEEQRESFETEIKRLEAKINEAADGPIVFETCHIVMRRKIRMCTRKNDRFDDDNSE